VNHVPDEALSAIDGFGEGLLVGEPRPVSARLRSDLRLRIPCDRAALDAGETAIEFRLDHGRTEPTLGAYGPFVGTVVEGVERRLREWGIDPPAAYEYDGTEEGRHRYAGRLRLP
jgi:hypothetical protein